MDQTPTPPPVPPQKDDPHYWQNMKDFAVAAFSAAIGDPEAIKTVVDVLTNASCQGLEHLDLKDEQRNEVKRKIEEGLNTGADGIIYVLSSFQKASQESNAHIREKFGRKKKE